MNDSTGMTVTAPFTIEGIQQEPPERNLTPAEIQAERASVVVNAMAEDNLKLLDAMATSLTTLAMEIRDHRDRLNAGITELAELTDQAKRAQAAITPVLDDLRQRYSNAGRKA